MNAPSDYEKRIVAMVDSFTKTVARNFSRNLKRAKANREKHFSDEPIPFMGYLGINQTACSCTVGTLPSGVTVKSNTAATASKAGSVVLTFAANATLPERRGTGQPQPVPWIHKR